MITDLQKIKNILKNRNIEFSEDQNEDEDRLIYIITKEVSLIFEENGELSSLNSII